MMDEEKKAYSKGYQAGLKRNRREIKVARIRNERLTALTASIIGAGMNGAWGTQVNGTFKKHNLEELGDMALREATRITEKMKVF